MTSIIIVTRDREETLASCLRSLASEEPSVIELIVLDNGSSDGTSAMLTTGFPAVRLIRSEENLGFARAANRAAREAVGGQLLFLNDDTHWPGRILPELLARQARLPAAGMVGCRLRNPDGTVQPSIFRFPTPWRAALEIVGLDRLFPTGSPLGGYGRFRYDQEMAVDFVSGACFLVPRELFLASGGFDERFFMYGEETDLALRLRREGRRCWFLPCGEVVHLGSANSRLDEEPPEEYLRGHLRYCATHMGAVGFRLYLGAKILGYLVRSGAARILGRPGRVRRNRRFIRAFAGALVTGRGPFFAGQPGKLNDKVGVP